MNLRFENDVKTYGTETGTEQKQQTEQFENDVKTYGTETPFCGREDLSVFENDVKTYGTETLPPFLQAPGSLRMM